MRPVNIHRRSRWDLACPLVARAGTRAAWVLGSALALFACGDDDASDSGAQPEATTRCSGDELQQRKDGAWVKQRDCAAEGMVCSEGDAGVAECVAPPCNDGEKDCDGDVLVVCEGGAWKTEQDCAATGLKCVPLLGGLPLCSSER